MNHAELIERLLETCACEPDADQRHDGSWEGRIIQCANCAASTALAALVAERDALRMCAEAGGELLKAIDAGRMRQRVGVTGQTMDAQLRASVYDGVPAYPVEEAREKYALALASLKEPA